MSELLADYGWLLVVAGLFLLAPLLATVAFYVQIRALSKPALPLEPTDPYHCPMEAADVAAHHPLIAARGYRFLGLFRLQAIQTAIIVAWEHTERPSYVCMYYVGGQRVYDLVTLYADDVALTTSSTKDAQLLPRPAWKYAQGFPGWGLEQLFLAHDEAERFLVSGGARPLAAAPEPFVARFANATREQALYVRSLAFWPFRGLWWYFIRRSRLAGLSVEAQHQRGWAKLPREILR